MPSFSTTNGDKTSKKHKIFHLFSSLFSQKLFNMCPHKASVLPAKVKRSFIHLELTTMNKGQLVEVIAKECDLSKAKAEQAVNCFMATVKKALKKGDSVQLIGFGTFSVKKRAARKGRNPATGETIKIKAARLPKFAAGKAFKEAL